MHLVVIVLMIVLMRLQMGRRMTVIVSLERVILMLVLVPTFPRRVAVAVAVLVCVRMSVIVRVLMRVDEVTMPVLVPVSVRVLVVMLMPVLVRSMHDSRSFAQRRNDRSGLGS